MQEELFEARKITGDDIKPAEAIEAAHIIPHCLNRVEVSGVLVRSLLYGKLRILVLMPLDGREGGILEAL